MVEKTVEIGKTEKSKLRDVNKSRYEAILAKVVFVLIGLFIMFR